MAEWRWICLILLIFGCCVVVAIDIGKARCGPEYDSILKLKKRIKHDN